MQRWRPIPGFEGYYSASNYGDIRRDKRGPHTRPGLILKPRVNRGGYPQLGLHREGQPKKYAPVHRWVAVAWLGNPGPNFEINHIDGDKENAAVENLEWVDKSANMNHAITTGLYSPPVLGPMYGERNPAAKITEATVREIRAAEGTVVELGARFGIHFSTIARIRKRVTWKEVI